MDVYFIRDGAGVDMYCQGCTDRFLQEGGDPNDIDGPYPKGGGEADLIHHCDGGNACVLAMQTKFGLKGVCFRNSLTSAGMVYTTEALRNYTNGYGIPEVLDLWADTLLDHSLDPQAKSVVDEYNKLRIAELKKCSGYVPDDQLVPLKSKKKQDTKMSSMMAFFDDRPVVSNTIHCRSCKDTGVIVLFSSSVECTDCSKNRQTKPCYNVDILF